ncbi:sulfotransferase domain-containing protein [Methylohalobius crimeensis]|uniref:sulfotransferase domain-containing protein n=1 Tax=Methylohalobius crimeensis TaxID=244365 RepID=UPI0003B697E5|nr:sulfotransferase domain-containing protein [Methylohalobius crimeensis]
MKKPNFFIIGAPKCGTTSMAAWLGEHPNIYMSPEKEPWFFCSDIRYPGIKTWGAYLQLFQAASPEKVRRGEASVPYLFSQVAVPTIERQLPGSTYIVMLRNPVEMAYAYHGQHLRYFQEDIDDFSQAWRLAPNRRAGHHVPSNCPDPILLDYSSWCLLGEQLERLYSIVPRERVLVLLLDDVKENPRREYLKVLDFLGLLDDGRQSFPVHNAAREWRLKKFAKLTHTVRIKAAKLRSAAGVNSFGLKWLVDMYESLNFQQYSRPPMSAQLREELVDFFAEDIQRLERMLNRDLSAWRKK